MTRLVVDRTWDGDAADPGEVATLELAVVDDVLEVRVAAPFHGDPPPAVPPGPTDRLWEHEVVELFVLAEASDPPAYVELELGPHGHHLLLRLEGVRRRVAGPLPVDFTATIAGRRWHGTARVPLTALPPSPHRVNAYAIHGGGAARRYLAWQSVPGEAPDFHRLGCFAPLQLLP